MNHSLKTTFPAIPDFLFYCDLCPPPQPASNEYLRHIISDVCITVHCAADPHHQWHVCTLCSSARTRINNNRTLSRHLASTLHLSNVKKHAATINNDMFLDLTTYGHFHHNTDSQGDDDSYQPLTSLNELSEAASSHSVSSESSEDVSVSPHPHSNIPFVYTNNNEIVTFDHCSPNQVKYFQHELNSSNNTSGLAMLVAQSLYKNDLMSSSLCKKEIDLHISLAAFLSTLTHGQKEAYAYINMIADDLRLISPSKLNELPKCLKLIHSRYCSGKFSILKNLPFPSVKQVGRHSYVSVIECIADLLGNIDSNIEIISDHPHHSLDNMNSCRRAHQIRNESSHLNRSTTDSLLTLFIIEWADEMEPSRSIKDNRGGAWMKTITISPNKDRIGSFDNTYAISIGPAGDSHEEIEELYAEEITRLRTGTLKFYHGKYKKNVCVYADVLASLQDQPARRKSNSILMGNSQYTPRWGHIVDCSAATKPIPSCLTCKNRLLNTQDVGSPTCEQCYNWNTSSVTFPAPTNLHANVPRHEGNIMISNVMNFPDMIGGALHVQRSIIDNTWTIANSSAYLRLLGINEESADEIIDSACRRKEFIRLHPTLTPPDFWKPPTMWTRNVPLSCHIDVPMHLLFLGIVKSTLSIIHDWATSQQIKVNLTRSSEFNLQRIKSIHLSWCKTIPYSKEGPTGWVSENYVGLCKLVTWFYAAFVTNHIRLQEDRTMITILIVSLRLMICRVMATSFTEQSINLMEKSIKVFLNAYTEVDKKIPSSKERWLQKSNFLCLLNVPSIIRAFGPIRNYWEGSALGEKILQIPKGMWHGFTHNWSVNMLRHMSKNKAIIQVTNRLQKTLHGIEGGDNIEAAADEAATAEAVAPEADIASNHRRYRNLTEINTLFTARTGISAIYLTDSNRLGIVLKKDRMIVVNLLDNHVRVCGDWYFEMSLNQEIINFRLQDYNHVHHDCLMLPLPNVNVTALPRGVTNRCLWTVITSEWRCLNSEKNFSEPTMNGYVYTR